jgi:hypothetical protein
MVKSPHSYAYSQSQVIPPDLIISPLKTAGINPTFRPHRKTSLSCSDPFLKNPIEFPENPQIFHGSKELEILRNELHFEELQAEARRLDEMRSVGDGQSTS